MTQSLEQGFRHRKTRKQRVANNDLNPQITQLDFMLPVPGTGQQEQVRTGFAQHCCQPDRTFDIVDSNDKRLRIVHPGILQQIKPRGIAEINDVAILPDKLDLTGVTVEGRKGNAFHIEDATNNLTEAAEPGDDDIAGYRIDRSLSGIPPGAPARIKAGSTAATAFLSAATTILSTWAYQNCA